MQELNIGITGASGFVGAALIKKLLINDNYGIKVFSRKSAVLPEFWHEDKKIEIFRGNILKDNELEKFINNCDVVIHLAGTFDLPFNNLFDVNVRTIQNVLQVCIDRNIKKIIFTSSIAVYGECRERPAREDDYPAPDTPYGLTKYLAEEVLAYYSRVYKIKTTILRLSTIYGPGNSKGVVHRLILPILNDQAVSIYGDGKQVRDYIYIDDAVDAVIAGINSESSGYDIYNVSSGNPVQLLELIHIIEKIINKKVKMEFKDADLSVNRYLVEDNDKIKKILNWRPKMSLNEGIRRTLESYGTGRKTV